ncbi:MAG: bifunctional folylpolyglutamate synthase/dihydrofolate synthase [Nitriliruptorales bacterium]
MLTCEEALLGLEKRIPSRMVPDLARITDLADLLADPQLTYPSIHITGTNGKTSVARMVTSLFGALGIQAGTYTSPHLQDVRERIRVAGRPISREDFAAAYAGVAPLAELVDARHPDHVSYFEMLTAMAYWWFADHPVDVGVFEVGMGGTWDATNLIRGAVAALTTVDIDHAQFLGSTPLEIAGEKVGIIKPGANVVSARQPDDVADLIRRRVDEQGGRLLLVGRDVSVENRRIAVGGQVADLVTPTRRYPEVVIPLHGAHQADNAAVAIGALHAFLDGLEDVDDTLVRDAFAAVEVPGRLEVASREPTVVLDGAHNPAGARQAAGAIREAFAFRDVILVFACLGDKDVAGLLGPFRDLASHVVVTRAPSDRAPEVSVLEAAANSVWDGTGVAVEGARSVAQALEKATAIAGESDAVLVTGSLYTVGAARDVLIPFED